MHRAGQDRRLRRRISPCHEARAPRPPCARAGPLDARPSPRAARPARRAPRPTPAPRRPPRTDPNAVHVVGTTFRDAQGRQLLFRGYNTKTTTLFDVTFDDGRARTRPSSTSPRPRPRASSSSAGTSSACPSAGAASSRSRSSTRRPGCRSSTPCSPWRTSTRSTSCSTCTRTRTPRRSARTASPSGPSCRRPRSCSRGPSDDSRRLTPQVLERRLQLLRRRPRDRRPRSPGGVRHRRPADRRARRRRSRRPRVRGLQRAGGPQLPAARRLPPDLRRRRPRDRRRRAGALRAREHAQRDRRRGRLPDALVERPRRLRRPHLHGDLLDARVERHERGRAHPRAEHGPRRRRAGRLGDADVRHRVRLRSDAAAGARLDERRARSAGPVPRLEHGLGVLRPGLVGLPRQRAATSTRRRRTSWRGCSRGPSRGSPGDRASRRRRHDRPLPADGGDEGLPHEVSLSADYVASPAILCDGQPVTFTRSRAAPPSSAPSPTRTSTSSRSAGRRRSSACSTPRGRASSSSCGRRSPRPRAGTIRLAPKFDLTPFRTPDSILEPLAREVAAGAGLRDALDVMCGTGAAMAALRPLCTERVVGMDFSAGMLAEARARVSAAPGSAAVELVPRRRARHELRSRVRRRRLHRRLRAHPREGRAGAPREHPARAPSRRALRLPDGGAAAGRPSPGFWLAHAFNAAMRVRNALIKPPSSCTT